MLPDIPGLRAGLTGAALALIGLLVAVAAGLRWAAVARRGKGRIARGVAAAGAVLLASGLAFFLASNGQHGFVRAMDAAALPFAGAALVLAGLACARAARRPRPVAAPGADAASPPEPR